MLLYVCIFDGTIVHINIFSILSLQKLLYYSIVLKKKESMSWRHEKELMHSESRWGNIFPFLYNHYDLISSLVRMFVHPYLKFCITNDFKFRGRNFIRGVGCDDPSLNSYSNISRVCILTILPYRRVSWTRYIKIILIKTIISRIYCRINEGFVSLPL